MKPFDPSKRPKPPRYRAEKRGLATIGSRATLTTRVISPLSDEALRRISVAISFERSKAVLMRRALQDIAGTYLRQREQPEPSKPEARYGLEMLAHKIWLLGDGCADEEASGELRRWLWGMNQLAMSALWGGLDRQPEYDGKDFFTYLRRSDLDWKIVGKAATAGRLLLTGGDYSNKPASIAVSDLISLYERTTRSKPTFFSKAVGVAVASGTTRQLGASSCVQFVVAFFREVDDRVTPEWLSNKVQALLHPRVKRHLKQGANLSHC